MLEKKAELIAGRDKQGLVIVDKASNKGVRIPNEALLQITLVVWELCDKMEQPAILEKVIGDAKVSDEQKQAIKDIIAQAIELFIKVGWVVEKE